MARKEKNIHYIYKTTCNITGRWYIGMHSTYNLNDGYMGSGLILRRSIRKYGVDNHTKEILEYVDSREKLVLREIEIINEELISNEFCMNLKRGGEGGFSSEDHKLRCTIAGNDKLRDLLIDIDYKEKHCLRLNEANKKARLDGKIINIQKNYSWSGKNHSEETKELMSEKKKGVGIGETNSQYGTSWITKDGFNKKIKKEEIIIWLNEGWVKGRK